MACLLTALIVANLCTGKFGDTGSNTFAPNFVSKPHPFSHGSSNEVACPTLGFHPRKFGGASGRRLGGQSSHSSGSRPGIVGDLPCISTNKRSPARLASRLP